MRGRSRPRHPRRRRAPGSPWAALPGGRGMTQGATDLRLNLGAGVALLLWGVRMVRTGMTRAFGAQLRRLLGRAMQNRFRAFAAGIGVTALLQSSTATGMIVASFAGRGLIFGPAAIAVLLGAGIGTSISAQ